MEMKEGSKVSFGRMIDYYPSLKIICLDGDTIFCFNYRSDRMREITSVLGLPNKPMEVTIPKDLVSFMIACYSLIY